ncbi:MAG: gliding motility-associated C-terminal domain-containing protein [Bacteroidia bacterium]|nr:gliding motility-associated C-terminal domain-containing protein [Bacteroidia bacterium]MDW8158094.1 gliding motility-associated C-terminal domain-containing protein [Bacteroidia bacterium]
MLGTSYLYPNIVCFNFLYFIIITSIFAATYTVNNTSDFITGGGTQGTLRYCLLQARTGDIIEFAPTITEIFITSPLPPITQSIAIQGGTSDGTLDCPRLVTLNGNGLNAIGLELQANNIRIYNLRIINFAQSGIKIQNASNCLISNCVIAGNAQYQIWLQNAPNTRIQGNKIGITCDAQNCHTFINPTWNCNPNPTASQSLNRSGIYIENSNSFIIDSANIIGCSCHCGIEIFNSSLGIIQDNQIGYNARGNIGNRFHAIRIRGDSQNNRILGNTIAYSDNLDRSLSIASNGIDLLGANTKYNTIQSNSIFCNSGKGIQIRNGLPSLNANEMIQEPEIISAYYCPDGSNLVEGAAYQPNVQIEIFQSLPSCNCAGWRSLGTVRSATTPIPGSNPPKYPWVFNELNKLDFTLLPLQITATATDANGNTSEFALCQVVCTLSLKPGLQDTLFCQNLESFVYDITPFIQTSLSYRVSWKRIRDENNLPVNEEDTVANANRFTSRKLGTWRINVLGCNGNCRIEKEIRVCNSPRPQMHLPINNITPLPVNYQAQETTYNISICEPTRLVLQCIGERDKCKQQVGGCHRPYNYTWLRYSKRQTPAAQILTINDSSARGGQLQDFAFLEINPKLCGRNSIDTFLLQARNSQGCLSQTTLIIQRNCRPQFTLGSRRQESCQSLTLRATPMGTIGIPANSSFEWFLNGQPQPPGADPTSLTLTGPIINGQVICKITTPQGCQASDTVQINIKPAPQLPNFQDILSCKDVVLFVDAEPQVSYLWQAPPLPNKRGNYFEIQQQSTLVEVRVKLIAENVLGCITEREFLVRIAPGFRNCPLPSTFTLCPSQKQTIIAERPNWVTSAMRYSWRIGNQIIGTEQAITLTNDAPQLPTPRGLRFGENTIVLQLEEPSFGCSLSCTLRANISPEVVLQPLRPQTVCEGKTLRYQALPPCTEPCKHTWIRLPLGNEIGNGSSIEINDVKLNENGQRLRLIRTNTYGCSASIEIPIQVAAIPKIEEIRIIPDAEREPFFLGTYDYRPGGKVEPSIFPMGSRVTFDFTANKPTNILRCNWSFFDRDCQTLVPIPSRSTQCYYPVKGKGLELVSGKNNPFCGLLSICDTIGCCTEQTFNYYVVADVSIRPNCTYITPGSLPPCERFYVVVASYKDYVLKIFDRWGELIHTCTNPEDENAQWDGRCKSDECQAGTYFWVLELTTPWDEKITRTGSITLLK